MISSFNMFQDGPTSRALIPTKHASLISDLNLKHVYYLKGKRKKWIRNTIISRMLLLLCTNKFNDINFSFKQNVES
jgi:hypothetical protein